MLMPGYKGLRSRETSLDLLIRHESCFDLVLAFPVVIFTTDSTNSQQGVVHFNSVLTIVKSTA